MCAYFIQKRDYVAGVAGSSEEKENAFPCRKNRFGCHLVMKTHNTQGSIEMYESPGLLASNISRIRDVVLAVQVGNLRQDCNKSCNSNGKPFHLHAYKEREVVMSQHTFNIL